MTMDDTTKINVLERQKRALEIQKEYRCKEEDAILLLELEEVLDILNLFFKETLDFDSNITSKNYSSNVNVIDFVEKRTNILLRLTNVQNLLMTAHGEARQIWFDAIGKIITDFKEIPMEGERIKPYNVMTDIQIFRQEMRNFIERGDIAKLMALKAHALPDPDKIYTQAIKSIGTSHQAKWIYQTLVKFGKGTPMTAKSLSALTGYNEKTVSDALSELREKGSQIVEVGYSQSGTDGRPAQTFWIPEVFRQRYVGD